MFGRESNGGSEDKKIIFLILLLAIIIGVLWEIFEFVIDVNIFTDNYFIDTLTDLFMAIIGAILASEFFVSKKDESQI